MRRHVILQCDAIYPYISSIFPLLAVRGFHFGRAKCIELHAPHESCDTTLVARATTHLPYPTLYVSVHQLTHAKFVSALLLRLYVLNVSTVLRRYEACVVPRAMLQFCDNSARARHKNVRICRWMLGHKFRISDVRLTAS
jgi:hypothetical protein